MIDTLFKLHRICCLFCEKETEKDNVTSFPRSLPSASLVVRTMLSVSQAMQYRTMIHIFE